ncbi:MAG: hypothetical protein DRN49_00820 [Thaumarchaeota archaeon]|nr:MAG: hypothetical protein DRN49_00820 [Nitrososphaerota archaeon]
MRKLPSIDAAQVDMVLKRLSETNQDIVGVLVISSEGLMLTGRIPKNMDEDLASAVFTALGSIAQRVSQQIELGNVIQLIMFSEKGGVLIRCGKKSSLVVLMKPDANLGLILMDVMKVIKEIEDVLG